MGRCSDNCTCVVDAIDGLAVDGTGSIDDPFTIVTAENRVIPAVVQSATDLATLTVDPGTTAYVIDEDLLYRFHDNGGLETEHGWKPVAAAWARRRPIDIVVSSFGTWYETEGLTLPTGAWEVIATGRLYASLDVSALSIVEIELYDPVNSYVLGETKETFNNPDAVNGYEFDASFALQDIVASDSSTPRSVVVRVNRVEENGTVLAMNLVSLRIHAKRMSAVDLTVNYP